MKQATLLICVEIECDFFELAPCVNHFFASGTSLVRAPVTPMSLYPVDKMGIRSNNLYDILYISHGKLF